MLNLMLNMNNKDYTKVNLREFRHNLSQLKDSLSYGQMYEVTEKGKSIAYFIPSEYEVKVVKKKSKNSTEEFFKAVKELQDSIPDSLKKKLVTDEDFERSYSEEMERKHPIK
jgi:antitoxin (DNA-binding transcriptional repressor) of toxin-antitoxin stability system